MSLQAIFAPIQSDMQAVDQVIRHRLYSEVVLIRQIAEYIIAAGGKRLRPALVLLSSGAMGYQEASRHELAAVVEFIHTATLLHDDVVDESGMRRGRSTANALFGNAASVLVGDFLYSRAFQMMVGVGNSRVMEVLADATNVIAEGEVLQLLNVHDAAITEERYLQVIEYKTAKLFEAAMVLGAILAGASARQERAAREYGACLGVAFQLVDDVLDYAGNQTEMGKSVGDDLSEGKPTLPLIHAARCGTLEQSTLIRKAIEEGGLADIGAVMQAVQDTGALDYTLMLASRYVNRACQALSELPPSPYRDALFALAAFAVNRRY